MNDLDKKKNINHWYNDMIFFNFKLDGSYGIYFSFI
jgi:hypothetical protein